MIRVGVLGGVPPALGGGGLERQIDRTVSGLVAAGHTVTRIAQDGPGTRYDVVHAFGSEGDVQHLLAHWTQARAPLVMTPVLSTSPGRTERALQLASRWPAPVTYAALRRRALRRADALIAITDYERGVLRRLVGPGPVIEVIPNGVDPHVARPVDDLPPGYVLLLGLVSELKGQQDVIETLSGAVPVVVAGGFSGTAAAEARWRAAVARTGTTWLGHVADAGRVADLVAGASALVHLSRQEVQSLAVLEALAAATPVIASDLPSHRELAAEHPGWVTIVDGPDELRAAAGRLGAPPPPTRPAVPTWSRVAARVAGVYERVLSSRA